MESEIMKFMEKTTQLKNLILSKQLEFFMEAHNGLSAKIVEETGFKAIWASGLTIATSLAVRDNNGASWTQVVEICEFMSDATSIPILMDADTGYGNFNNVRRLVKKIEQRDIAGLCLEDKIFPKINSFLNGQTQKLADLNEMAGKIKCAKDTQNNPDFVVVARTEAFITEQGLSEVLKRAEAYRQAGADAILVHSKCSTCAEIDSFMQEWGNRHPIILVPTKYYTTTTEHFRQIGASVIIWANQNLRSAITEMQKMCYRIFCDQSLINIENDISSIKEVFRLQDVNELMAAEKKYLSTV